MSSNIHDLFGDINLHGGTISEAGFEVVESLPTSNLFEGRTVVFNHLQYCFLNNQWVVLSPLVELTYNELKALKDKGNLIPGQKYAIIDYVTHVYTQQYGDGSINPNVYSCRSAGNPYDIIVTALSSSELSENASARKRKNDKYFEKCNLNAWKLKYSLDNSIASWGYGGKGVVYYMEDEHGNSAYYDFKNIQYQVKKHSFLKSNIWYYTFSQYYTNADLSLTSNYCRNNKIGVCSKGYDSEYSERLTYYLPCNIITSLSVYNPIQAAIIENNVFGNNATVNVIQYPCASNTISSFCMNNQIINTKSTIIDNKLIMNYDFFLGVFVSDLVITSRKYKNITLNSENNTLQAPMYEEYSI